MFQNAVENLKNEWAKKLILITAFLQVSKAPSNDLKVTVKISTSKNALNELFK